MHKKFAAVIMGSAPSSLSQERLETWAKIASKRFVENSIPLNDSITKIAQENDLTPHHIERVCEMANLNTHTALMPNEPEKRASFGFPLADAKCIRIALGPKKPGATMSSDYAGPPKGTPSSGPSMADLFGVSGKGHNGFAVPEKKKVIIMIQKKAAERQRTHDSLLKTAMQCETAEKQFHKAAQQAVIQGSSLQDIHTVACHAGLGDVSGEVLQKTARLMKTQFLMGDMEKVAFEAPEELIDRDVPVRVINGRNPIIGSLKALKEYQNNAYCIRDGLMGLDQELEVLRTKLKELE